MNLLTRLINLGTDTDIQPVYNKHIRFTNAATLIVLGFIVPNAVLAWKYQDRSTLLVISVHLVLMLFVFVFNARGNRVLASSWWSLVAIPAVTYYSIAFTQTGMNFVFLPLVLFLQFFMFAPSDRKYLVAFVVFTLVAYTYTILCFQMGWQPFGTAPEGLIQSQHANALVGLPVLSLVFGLYAWHTITRAENEVLLEREKSERLLLNILPAAVAKRFKDDQSVLAQGYSSVSVLFVDIVDFTSFSEKTPPEVLLHFLNDVFMQFDAITEKYSLEKIKTIGDSYMVAGGVPEASTDHVRRICLMALDMQQVVSNIKTPDGEPLRMRIGISTGPVTAGVIGTKKFIYDLWGDTVNTASRMESHSEAGSIHITSEVFEIIRNEFQCTERGEIQVKGKGVMKTYFLINRKHN